MPSKRETVTFTAYGGSGSRVVLVADRVIASINGIMRKAPWSFATDRGLAVRRAGPPGCYTIHPGDVRLTTDDPNEPKD